MNNPIKDQPWSCEVRARDQVIRYRCEGSGRSLILLDSRASDPAWSDLLTALTQSYRVIVPELPPTGTDLTAWLSAFLEGLGGSGLRIVAADRFCLPAFEVALVEADEIARLVLVPEGPRSGGRTDVVLGGAVETEVARSRVPLLVVHREQPAAELLERVTRFLGPAGAAPIQPPPLTATSA